MINIISILKTGNALIIFKIDDGLNILKSFFIKPKWFL